MQARCARRAPAGARCPRGACRPRDRGKVRADLLAGEQAQRLERSVATPSRGAASSAPGEGSTRRRGTGTKCRRGDRRHVSPEGQKSHVAGGTGVTCRRRDGRQVSPGDRRQVSPEGQTPSVAGDRRHISPRGVSPSSSLAMRPTQDGQRGENGPRSRAVRAVPKFCDLPPRGLPGRHERKATRQRACGRRGMAATSARALPYRPGNGAAQAVSRLASVQTGRNVGAPKW